MKFCVLTQKSCFLVYLNSVFQMQVSHFVPYCLKFNSLKSKFPCPPSEKSTTYAAHVTSETAKLLISLTLNIYKGLHLSCFCKQRKTKRKFL